MKPYSDRANLEEECRLNFSLSRSRAVVENTFGRINGVFNKRIDPTVEHTVNIVTMCCMLHNFCILSNYAFLEEWMQIDVNWVNGGENQRIKDALKLKMRLNLFAMP